MYSNKITKQGALLLSLTLFFTTSCCKPGAEEYYQPPLNPDNTPIENPGEISINLTPIPEMPATAPQGTTTVTLTNERNVSYTIAPNKSIDLESGTYTVIAYTVAPDEGDNGSGVSSLPQGVLITSAAVSLPIGADKSTPNLPLLFASTAQAVVAPNVHTDINLDQQPLTRPILVNGTLKGISPTAIKGLTASLHGVATQQSISSPFSRAAIEAPANRGTRADANRGTRADNSAPYVSTAANIDNTGHWSTTFRLLGIDPTAKQTLRINLVLTDNTSYTCEVDMTQQLSLFNQGKASQPAKLDILLNVGPDSVSGSITGWKPGIDQDIDGQQDPAAH